MGNTKRHDYSKYFVIAERYTNKEKFIELAEHSPDNLKELARDIHFSLGCATPSDWVYKTISEAFVDLEENIIEDLEIEPDTYYCDLYKWFGEPPAHAFCNEYMDVAEDYGTDVYSVIAGGQCMTKERIYEMVNHFLQEAGNG
jgi:hypothetical protein